MVIKINKKFKTKDIEKFKESINYFHSKEEGKKYRWSLSKFIPETRIVYYKCYDSKYKGFGLIKFNSFNKSNNSQTNNHYEFYDKIG